METTSLVDNLVDRGRNSGLVGHIGSNGEKLARVFLGDSGKIIPGLTNVDRVDLIRAVV